MKTRPYVTLDVFTSRRFAGNPLAVVRNAEGLDTAAMQLIAAEFNLPETVFLLPPEGTQRARLRIFTTKAELPFAGHPTVGTAVLLGLEGGNGSFVLQETIGDVPCRFDARGPDSGFATFDLPRLPKRVADAAEAEALASALNLTLDDLGCEDFAPGIWSAGNAFTFVPVRGLDAIGRATPALPLWRETFGTPKQVGAFLFCRETAEKGHAFHARMFAPSMGIAEDPATGSALAAFAGLVGESLGDGERKLAVEQGYEMGRPSVMHLTLTKAGGALTAASIGGDAIVVARGELIA